MDVFCSVAQPKSYYAHSSSMCFCMSLICNVQYSHVVKHFPCYLADSIHGRSYKCLWGFLFVCLLCDLKKRRQQLMLRSPGNKLHLPAFCTKCTVFFMKREIRAERTLRQGGDIQTESLTLWTLLSEAEEPE